MKTKNLFTTVLLATMFAQMPADSNALNIRVRKIISNEMSKCPGKNNQPAVPITYYDEAAKTFSITSRVSIPEAVITVTKDGVEISNETMPINNCDHIVEYGTKVNDLIVSSNVESGIKEGLKIANNIAINSSLY